MKYLQNKFSVGMHSSSKSWSENWDLAFGKGKDKKKRTRVKCSVCSGTGNEDIEDGSWVCGNCKGKGTVLKSSEEK